MLPDYIIWRFRGPFHMESPFFIVSTGGVSPADISCPDADLKSGKKSETFCPL
jgi:hypothetical protein